MRINKSLITQIFPWLIVAISLILLTLSFVLFISFKESTDNSHLLISNDIFYLICFELTFVNNGSAR